jgi:hypothetical protein
MALFSFADISFKNTKRTGFGTNGLALESQYSYDIYRYPQDLGSADKGHYIVFHINQQKKTNFKGQTTGDQPTIIKDRVEGRSYSPGQSLSDLTNLASTKFENVFGSSETVQNITKATTDVTLNFTRTIERVRDTVALYMPDTLSYIHNQGYSGLEIGNDPIARGLDATSTLVDTIRKSSEFKQGAIDVFKNLSPFIANEVAKGSAFLTSGFAAIFGVVQNPKLELIYSTPSFRTFRFDFVFYPRSESEATEVQKIITRLKFHQAPEISTEGKGFFLVPPSEFDVQFYYNGKINPNIPRITTCVLESIDLDYAPNGFTAYEVPNEPKPSIGRTGMPVAIRMSLQFKETDIVTKSFFGADRFTAQSTQYDDYNFPTS